MRTLASEGLPELGDLVTRSLGTGPLPARDARIQVCIWLGTDLEFRASSDAYLYLDLKSGRVCRTFNQVRWTVNSRAGDAEG